MTAYLSVTVHYIDKNWDLKAELLAFDEMGGSHTGENTGRVLYDILEATGIKHKVRLNTSWISTFTHIYNVFSSVADECNLG